MRPEYDVTFPNGERNLFDGGLNNKFERSIIANNESPDCLNVIFINGAVESRAGATKFNTAAIGAYVFDGLYTRRGNDGVETMVAFAGGSAWQLTGASTFTTIPSGQSVFTAGVRVATALDENHLFMGNGFITPYKYNGTDFTRHGVPAPITSSVVTASAAGGTFTSADFYYKVSYVNSQAVEGSVGPSTATATVGANGSVRISAIPTAPQSHGVSSRRLYRASGTAGIFQRIATISDNTTTSFVDTYFPVSSTAPTDNGEPPNYSTIVYHQGRLFCNDHANGNFVWYSNLSEPFTFSSANFREIGDNSSDIIKGLAVYNGALMVFGEATVHMIMMPTTNPLDWQVIRIRTEYGSRSPFGTFLFNNRIMFPAIQGGKVAGFAAVQGSTIDQDATFMDKSVAGSDRKSERIEPDIFNFNETYLGNVSALVYKNKAYISVTYTSSTTNNRVYVYDFSRSNLSSKQEAAWSPVTGLAAAQFTIFNGKLYYGSSTATGFVYQLETTTYGDDGTAINSYFWTKEFSGLPGHENLEKDFRQVRLLVEKVGAYYMNVTLRTDSDLGDGTTYLVSLDPHASTWGAFNWGAAVWGGGAAQKEETLRTGATGKRLQLRFSNQNTVNQRFKVHGMNFTYNIKGKR